MKKQKKTEQINLRVTREEKERIKYLSKKSNNISLSEYIISRSLNLNTSEDLTFNKVYTLTLNPWLSCELSVHEIKKHISYDTNKLLFFINASGINISKILTSFNVPTLAMYYAGGFSGNYLEEYLKDNSINGLKFEAKQSIKIDFHIKGKNEDMFIKGNWLKIDKSVKEILLNKIRNIKRNEFLILGDLYHPDDYEFVKEIAKICILNRVNLILDLNSNFDLELLKYKPTILKIRFRDLQKIYPEIKTEDNYISKEMCSKIKEILKDFKARGAKNILLTFGKKGSFLYNSEDEFYVATLKMEINDVYYGAGDAFLGAYVSNYLINSYDAFLIANAAGLASVYNKKLPTVEEINLMRENVNIKVY